MNQDYNTPSNITGTGTISGTRGISSDLQASTTMTTTAFSRISTETEIYKERVLEIKCEKFRL